MRHCIDSAMRSSLFFELLQISLDHRSEFSHTPTEEEWRELYLLSRKQALMGIAFSGIERLPDNQRPPKPILLQWIISTERIKEINAHLDKKAVSISQQFRNDGFRNVILKGQGVARYYKIDGLDKFRTPGDVDIWLDGSRRNIVNYVRNVKPDAKIVYHHVDFPKVDGVEVEVHFTPSWMNCYFTNRKLQRYFHESKIELFQQNSNSSNDIPIPTLAFNRVYILVHIYRHLFHEGIGLRQLMDYYYVLRQGFTEDEREKTMGTLCSFKMKRFAGAVMWVLQEVFGMEDDYILTKPNEREGQFLLNEVMRSGNFGQYDKSMVRKSKESDLSYGLRKIRRNFRFVWSYPTEVLWSPLFKFWHFFWRKKQQTD